MAAVLSSVGASADQLPSRMQDVYASPVARLGRRVSEWAARPLPAYVTHFLLQLKIVWGMWWVRDFTTGDTSAYFMVAYRWYLQRSLDLVWLPLYSGIYYGSFLHLTRDAYRVTIAHRLVLVLVLAPLVLGLMRQLLEPRIAWLMAAWWAVLPVNHDVLYEIHLFGVLPLVVAALTILGPPSPWRRGLAIAILVGGAFLVRNELIVPAALLALACGIFEARTARLTAPPARRHSSRLLVAYGLPVVVALAVPVALYATTSQESVGVLARRMGGKHGLNTCQVYAYGYWQRHPDWPKNPWLDCRELMLATFGRAEPSMSEAFLANPRAMAGHFLWNIGLVPNGLQVLLFNSTSGTARPGYEIVAERSTTALALSVVLALVYLAGAVVIARDWGYWWSTWLRPRIWGWLTLACASIGCLLVMVTQRPRPAYIFSLELSLQAVAGLCLLALLERWNLRGRFTAAFPLLMLLLLSIVPSYYARAENPPERPILEAYRALHPFRAMIRTPGTVIVTPGYGFELCAYLGVGQQPECRYLDYYVLRGEVRAPSDWWPLLETRGANMFYANEAVTADPAMREALAGAAAAGWEVLMRETTGRGERALLRKSASASPQHASADRNPVAGK